MEVEATMNITRTAGKKWAICNRGKGSRVPTPGHLKCAQARELPVSIKETAPKSISEVRRSATALVQAGGEIEGGRESNSNNCVVRFLWTVLRFQIPVTHPVSLSCFPPKSLNFVAKLRVGNNTLKHHF